MIVLAVILICIGIILFIMSLINDKYALCMLSAFVISIGATMFLKEISNKKISNNEIKFKKVVVYKNNKDSLVPIDTIYIEK